MMRPFLTLMLMAGLAQAPRAATRIRREDDDDAPPPWLARGYRGVIGGRPQVRRPPPQADLDALDAAAAKRERRRARNLRDAAARGEAPVSLRQDGGTWTEVDHMCARCGSSVDWEACGTCGGEGHQDGHAEDPLWWDESEGPTCDICEGAGGWHVCISSPEWCEANPLPGRADVQRGQVEVSDGR